MARALPKTIEWLKQTANTRRIKYVSKYEQGGQLPATTEQYIRENASKEVLEELDNSLAPTEAYCCSVLLTLYTGEALIGSEASKYFKSLALGDVLQRPNYLSDLHEELINALTFVEGRLLNQLTESTQTEVEMIRYLSDLVDASGHITSAGKAASAAVEKIHLASKPISPHVLNELMNQSVSRLDVTNTLSPRQIDPEQTNETTGNISEFIDEIREHMPVRDNVTTPVASLVERHKHQVVSDSHDAPIEETQTLVPSTPQKTPAPQKRKAEEVGLKSKKVRIQEPEAPRSIIESDTDEEHFSGSSSDCEDGPAEQEMCYICFGFGLTIDGCADDDCGATLYDINEQKRNMELNSVTCKTCMSKGRNIRIMPYMACPYDSCENTYEKETPSCPAQTDGKPCAERLWPQSGCPMHGKPETTTKPAYCGLANPRGKTCKYDLNKGRCPIHKTKVNNKSTISNVPSGSVQLSSGTTGAGSSKQPMRTDARTGMSRTDMKSFVAQVTTKDTNSNRTRPASSSNRGASSSSPPRTKSIDSTSDEDSDDADVAAMIRPTNSTNHKKSLFKKYVEDRSDRFKGMNDETDRIRYLQLKSVKHFFNSNATANAYMAARIEIYSFPYNIPWKQVIRTWVHASGNRQEKIEAIYNMYRAAGKIKTSETGRKGDHYDHTWNFLTDLSDKHADLR